MVIETGIILFGIASVGSIGIWSLRQEGRINGHDRMFEEREKTYNAQVQLLHISAVQRHADTQARLDRIEAKLDRLPWSLSTKS